MAISGNGGGFHRAFGRRGSDGDAGSTGADRLGDCFRNGGDLLLDLKPNQIIFQDLRSQLEGDADVLSFDSDERTAGDALRLSCGEGPVFTPDDLGLLIVGRQHMGGRQDIGVGQVQQEMQKGADVDRIE